MRVCVNAMQCDGMTRYKFFIGPRCPWGPIYGSGPMSVRPTPFADLTDVTLADENNNSIQTDDVNRAIIGNVAMQVAPPGGQIEINASGTTW